MDLTNITTPFGLLDEATQRALRECGGPWELWEGGDWIDVTNLERPTRRYAYRLKPQPPKPREVWTSDLSCFWNTREEAARYSDGHPVMLFREVIE